MLSKFAAALWGQRAPTKGISAEVVVNFFLATAATAAAAFLLHCKYFWVEEGGGNVGGIEALAPQQKENVGQFAKRH